MTQLPVTPEQLAHLQQLLGTDTGKQLVSLLQKKQGPSIREACSRQDYDSAGVLARQLLQDPEIRELLTRLEG